MRPNTVVLGNLSRSVRDAARYYDVCAGPHPYDPSSLPSPGGWEAGLGSHDLAGRKVAIVPDLGGVTLEPGVEERIRSEAKALIADTGMVEVDVAIEPPNLAAQWMMGNLATLLADLDGAWPRCAGQLTDEIAMGLRLARSLYNLDTAAAAEVAAHRRQRGHGRRLRPGRLRHRRHQPRARVRRRGLDQQPAGRPDRLRHVVADGQVGDRRRARGRALRDRRRPQAARRAARPGRRDASPTW